MSYQYPYYSPHLIIAIHQCYVIQYIMLFVPLVVYEMIPNNSQRFSIAVYLFQWVSESYLFITHDMLHLKNKFKLKIVN